MKTILVLLLTLLVIYVYYSSREKKSVKFYKDTHYTGLFFEAIPGKYDTDVILIGDDSIKSVVIPRGLRVVLYEDTNFSGNTSVLTENTPIVKNIKPSSLIIEST